MRSVRTSQVPPIRSARSAPGSGQHWPAEHGRNIRHRLIRPVSGYLLELVSKETFLLPEETI